MRVENIWQWEGRVDRGTYAAVGISAFALKFLLDWLVVTRLFQRQWSLLNYWRPFGAISGVHRLEFADRVFAGVMLSVAVPFFWLGVALTVESFRDSAGSTYGSALFFFSISDLACLS